MKITKQFEMFEKLSDDSKIVMLAEVLADEGRKRGVTGNIAIFQTEVFGFCEDWQKRSQARLPNGGFGMDPMMVLPIVMEEMESGIERFWTRRIKGEQL
jgi:hypothetical protein